MAELRATVTIETDRCKGCGLCIVACPSNILILKDNWVNTKGYQPAAISDPDECTGCGNCSLMCPDSCITVKRFTRKRSAAYV